MIQHAESAMLPQLTELWKHCFGDSIEYSSFFFAHKMVGEEVFENQYVIVKDGKVVSMLSVLSAIIVDGEEKTPFWYVYGVATSSDYRNQGLAGELLTHVLSIAKKKGIAVGLVPANEPLFYYYEKFGFTSYFKKKKLELTLDERKEPSNCNISYQPLDAVSYNKERNQAFQDITYIKWDDVAAEYALMENEKSDGMAYSVQIGENRYFILYAVSEGILYVRETNLFGQELEVVCQELGKKCHCMKAVISLALVSEESCKIVEHGMICNYNTKNESAYLGLALD